MASPEWTAVQQGGASVPQHALYHQLAGLNGEVNGLKIEEVQKRLEELGLTKTGVKDILCKRLKSHLRLECIAKDPSAPWELRNQCDANPYHLDYLCVLDFEATCEEPNPPDYIHEIIEFPVILLNLRTLQVDNEFHSFCRPLLQPLLSDFCERLTGISQAKVDRSATFVEVLQLFDKWLEDHELGSKYKFALATDCPWDIKECLFPQCVLSQTTFPPYATKWLDVRKMFSSFYRVRSGNISGMLESLGLQFQGREHSGIDDAKNISRVLVQLIKDGCILKYNRFIPNDALQQFKIK